MTFLRPCVLKVSRRFHTWRSKLFILFKIFLIFIAYTTLQANLQRTNLSQKSNGHHYTSNERPSIDLSTLWRNATRSVVDCRTGNDVRILRDARTIEELNSGTAIKEPDGSSPETDAERKESFVEIYNRKTWRGQISPRTGSDAIIGSGPGSTLRKTVSVRKTLLTVIEQVKRILGKNSLKILDIPCGDLNWMSLFMSNRSDVTYHGMDIVPDIISHHRDVYTPKYPHMTFINQDAVARPLAHKYDIIFTRHMTIHLSSYDTARVLKHFKDSGSHFLLATSQVPPGGAVEKFDVRRRGRHRLQNLEAPPISLPPPVCLSQDTGPLDYNGLWVLNL